MKHFALVKNGLPTFTATPALDYVYEDGAEFDGGVWREFPASITHHELLSEWCFYHAWRKRPGMPGLYYTWNNSAQAWEYDAVSARQAKILEIEKACEAAILAGFESNALGEAHHYPADLTDQSNLTASVMRSMLPATPSDDLFPFKCVDANDVWLFRDHTASQIQQVGRDGYASILAARQRNATLQAQIAIATTQAEIEAIQW